MKRDAPVDAHTNVPIQQKTDLIAAIKTQREEQVKLDVAAKLKDVSFGNLIAHLSPKGTAVDVLTADGARLKKRGVTKPLSSAN